MGQARTPPAAAEIASGGHVTGYGTPLYRNYVLNSLLLVYILNFVDRGLLSVVARPLKAEIHMSDTAWGLLTGFGFALLYTVVGIPIAQLSERKNRVWIMAACLALWSVMTALCGLAQDVTIWGVAIGGFWILLVCRIGVGIGEAGCTPPANSLIADYYPPRRRSTALGYYAMGVSLGTMLANLVGGPVADAYGWRMAFFVLGLPGVVVALLMVLTVKDAPRGHTDPPGVLRPPRASLSDALSEMLTKPAFWWMAAAATIAAFCGYAVANFQSLYLQRTFDISAGQAALWVNAPAYTAGAVGTVVTGWLAERIGARSVTAIAWIPAIGLFLCVPFYFLAFTTDSMMWCLVGLATGHFVKYGYLAAQYTIGQGVVSMRVRATATAILLFVINLFGYGLGPLFAGFLSDTFFRRQAAGAGYPELGTSTCDAAQEALKRAGPDAVIGDVLAGLRVPMSEAQHAFCAVANSQATETSMLVISSIYALGGLCFLMCMRTLKRDLIAK
jgi:MFS family permease